MSFRACFFSDSSVTNNVSNPDFKAACEQFLSHFDYLTSDNRRNGFFIKNMFCREDLTLAICNEAVKLKASINSFNLREHSEQDLLNAIEHAIDAVANLRKDSQYCDHYHFIQSENGHFSRDTLSFRYDEEYYYTHANGLFESCLTQAINAAKPHLTREFASKADSLILKMQGHHSEKVVVWKDTYVI